MKLTLIYFLKNALKVAACIIIVAAFSLFVFELANRVDESDKILIDNKAMFMTHCIKVDKQPWYMCECAWDGFSRQFKLNFKSEAAKYM